MDIIRYDNFQRVSDEGGSNNRVRKFLGIGGVIVAIGLIVIGIYVWVKKRKEKAALPRSD
jgi:hypothetical protein